jgi:membrane protein DedA with SNARE-associated domain
VIGYGLLAAILFVESAGLPLPGEPALIAAAERLSTPLVIAVAIAAAVAGEAVAYGLGRRFGRGPLQRLGLAARAQELFAHHGMTVVVLARFVIGLRTVAAVLAGASGMEGRRFAAANVLGAVTWVPAVLVASHTVGAELAVAAAVAGLALLGAALRGRSPAGDTAGRATAKALAHATCTPGVRRPRPDPRVRVRSAAHHRRHR